MAGKRTAAGDAAGLLGLQATSHPKKRVPIGQQDSTGHLPRKGPLRQNLARLVTW
jgi:hypothetical protein